MKEEKESWRMSAEPHVTDSRGMMIKVPHCGDQQQRVQGSALSDALAQQTYIGARRYIESLERPAYFVVCNNRS